MNLILYNSCLFGFKSHFKACFYKSRYCEDYGNRGPDNRGPPVQMISLLVYFNLSPVNSI